MARHVLPRDPRAHWGLISLCLVTLAVLLFAQGYATDPPRDAKPARSTGKSPLAGSGPVVARDGDGWETDQMPRKTVALTFDGGPDPLETPKVLQALRNYDARATFFLRGSLAAAHPGLVREIADDGHEIGIQSHSQRRLGTMPGWLRNLELNLSQHTLAATIGKHSTLFRPPYTAGPATLAAPEYQTVRAASAAGYTVVLTDQDTRDQGGRTGAQVAAAGTPRKGDGAVIRMHDSNRNGEALGILLKRLDNRGYQFTGISEELRGSSPYAKAGVFDRATGHVLVSAQQAADFLVKLLLVALFAAGVLTLFRLVVLFAFALVHRRRVKRGARRARRMLRRARRATRRRLFRKPYRDPRPNAPPVSIVVPAFNEAAGIEATVRSLARTHYPGPLEIIVVDDGSTDETAQIVDNLGLPGLRVVQQPNSGKATALQTGLAHVRAELVVMIDGDTVFEPRTLERLLIPFMDDPEIGAVSGNTKVGNRQGILGRWQHLEYVIGFNLDRRMFDVLQCMPTVPGAIGAFRLSALWSVGGVSTDTLAEDTDLTMALYRMGWRVVYSDGATAWTEAPASLRELWRQRYRWCYGTLQSMWKHKAAFFSGGQGGRFGRRCLSYLGIYQVLLPLLAPAVDLFALYGLITGDFRNLLGVWLAFLGAQLLASAYALRLDGESLRVLWVLPLQQVVYRQLMYLITIQSVVTALLGAPLRWHPIRRVGTFAGQARVYGSARRVSAR